MISLFCIKCRQLESRPMLNFLHKTHACCDISGIFTTWRLTMADKEKRSKIYIVAHGFCLGYVYDAMYQYSQLERTSSIHSTMCSTSLVSPNFMNTPFSLSGLPIHGSWTWTDLLGTGVCLFLVSIQSNKIQSVFISGTEPIEQFLLMCFLFFLVTRVRLS